MLCLDVVQIICDFCDLKTQINLINTCKEYEENLQIIKLTCTDGINQQVTQEILQQKKFSQLRYLNASNNMKITNVNHLKNTLILLNCSGNCEIAQEGINELRKLQILNACDNQKITNVNHLKDTLIELDCCGNICGIYQKGINELRKLQKLKASCNEKITNVNHLKDTLIELDCNFRNLLIPCCRIPHLPLQSNSIKVSFKWFTFVIFSLPCAFNSCNFCNSSITFC